MENATSFVQHYHQVPEGQTKKYRRRIMFDGSSDTERKCAKVDNHVDTK